MIEQLTVRRGRILPQHGIVHEYGKVSAVREHEQSLELSLSGNISSPYGWRADPFIGKQDFHYGIDVVRSHGSEILAAGEGCFQRMEGWVWKSG